MKNKIIGAVGWIGTAGTLLAYFLISFGYVSAFSIWFQAINLVGAIGLVVIGFHKRAYQLVVVDAVWALIAVVAIFQIILK